MKILHTSDWHIGQFKGPVADGVNLRSQDIINCLEFMVETAREERPDLVCISGDIFHQEQIGPVRYSDEMVTATRIIEQLAETTNLVIVMRGTPNHDGAGQFRVLTKMLEHNKKIVVVTKPQVLHTPVANIACIPGFDKQEFRSRFPGLSADEENEVWTQQISNLVLGLRAQCRPETNIIPGEIPAILMAHYTVPGCNMESGQTSFFTNFEPVIPREALEAAHFEAVLLGHIHRPQILDGLHNVFYAGAINTMNFNDEGQGRGFWIHEFTYGNLTKGNLFNTPYRRFKTLRLEREEVQDYLNCRQAFLIEKTKEDDITDCIVRVVYSCTTEQQKALNVPALQSDLYACGAFYVSDIESDSMIEVTNRGLLSEESDPLLNLKKWLEEKCTKDSDKIVELAGPIIFSAISAQTVSDNHGVFRPVSISVKNYRNYKEETFDFSDVSFCSINGVNGAGKSSLFMDAVMDCLYEETREGDCKAWIRGSEDAKKGIIEFVFDIGDKRFRVVRTRVKSGKATLNISQQNGDEWLNLSAERIWDTQKQIEKILGMDSMTFRSCALIMQDQYGLFLQAKKEDRMTILGNLLGLGIYSLMEQDARSKLSIKNKELISQKEALKVKQNFIESKGDPEAELQDIEELITTKEKTLEELNEKKEIERQKKAQYEAELSEKDKLLKESKEVSLKISTTKHNINITEEIVKACDTMLEHADLIKEKAGEFQKLNEAVVALSKDVTQYEFTNQALSEKRKELKSYEKSISDTRKRNEQIEEEIQKLRNDGSAEVEEKLRALEEKRTCMQELLKKKDAALAISSEVENARSKAKEEVYEYSLELGREKSKLESCRKQEEFMQNSGCIDIEKATCQFLMSAKKDVAQIEDTQKRVDELTRSIQSKKEAYQEYEVGKKRELQETGYSMAKEVALAEEIKALEPWLKVKADLEEQKKLLAGLEAEKASNDKIIGLYTERASTVKLEATELANIVGKLSDSVKKYKTVLADMKCLESYTEQEKQLPVYDERRCNAKEKLKSLQTEFQKLEKKKLVVAAGILSVDQRLSEHRFDEKSMKATLLEIKKASDSMTDLQTKKGALQQKVDDIKQIQREIRELNTGIQKTADVVARYDVLKQAFSRDGVPHQIVRNIIPYITDTANSILGQMTGGTMGVEFLMERTVRGKDGDKATLDVLINEYGKTTLPYASKSGGEKVKASLAVILALSEIKATAAGIQLGMLFIDEPPFLDSDGAQAYVDSLETIRKRYPDVKVMAITHDDAMKARFPQTITVVKDENGSHVQWG